MGSPLQPEEFKEAVRALWRDGRSSGEIADAKGVTRNTVIGILQRLGEDRRTQGCGASAKALSKPKLASVPLASPTVSAEPRPISLAVVRAIVEAADAARAERIDRMKAWAKSVAQVVVRTPETSHPIAESEPVTFFGLEKCMCKWPLGRSPDDEALYCGARCEPRASYCDFHCDASTNPKYRRPRGASGERLPIGRSVTASVSRTV